MHTSHRAGVSIPVSLEGCQEEVSSTLLASGGREKRLALASPTSALVAPHSRLPSARIGPYPACTRLRQCLSLCSCFLLGLERSFLLVLPASCLSPRWRGRPSSCSWRLRPNRATTPPGRAGVHSSFLHSLCQTANPLRGSTALHPRVAGPERRSHMLLPN